MGRLRHDRLGNPATRGAIALPNGTVHRALHTGAGDDFQAFFERVQDHGAVQGAWPVSIVPGGTGGAFVGLYGFMDDVRKLTG